MFYETFICFYVSEAKLFCFSLCSQMFDDVERCWIYNIQNVCHANEQLSLCYFFPINKTLHYRLARALHIDSFLTLLEFYHCLDIWIQCRLVLWTLHDPFHKRAMHCRNSLKGECKSWQPTIYMFCVRLLNSQQFFGNRRKNYRFRERGYDFLKISRQNISLPVAFYFQKKG